MELERLEPQVLSKHSKLTFSQLLATFVDIRWTIVSLCFNWGYMTTALLKGALLVLSLCYHGSHDIGHLFRSDRKVNKILFGFFA